jgi:hypothetical protein
MKKNLTTSQRVGGLRYVGNGVYIPGVPARNLSPDEVLEYSDIITAQQEASGVVMYEVMNESPIVATEEN